TNASTSYHYGRSGRKSPAIPRSHTFCRLSSRPQTRLRIQCRRMSSPKPALDDLRIERRPETAPSSLQSWLVVVVVFLVLLAAAAVWWRAHSNILEVQTVVARGLSGGSGTDRTVLHASGYVTARRQATV